MVVADAGVDVVVAAGGRERFGEGVVGGRGSGAVGQGPVRPLVVVGRGELVEQGLQVGDGGGLVGLGAPPVLHRLLEPLHLAAGRGVVGASVLLRHVPASQLGFQGIAPALAAGQAGGEHQPVVGQGGRGGAVGGDRGPEGVPGDRSGDAGQADTCRA